MFEWADFLGLAERLAEAGGDEAAHRTAISRAYYAAYHAAAIYVRAEGILPDAHTHRRVWAALAADAVAERAEVGRRGDLLRQARAAADYRATFGSKYVSPSCTPGP